MCTGVLPPNNGVALDSQDVADAFVIEEFEPFPAAELTIHRQNINIFRLHDSEESIEDGDSLIRVRVASFGLLWKDFPDDGNGHFVDDYSYGEDIDVAFPILPIGAIHGESPAFERLGDFLQNEFTQSA